MRNVSLVFAALAVLCFSSHAFADQISGQVSVNGYAEAVGSFGMGSATGIDFANGTGLSVSGGSGELGSYGATLGGFSVLGVCESSDCGTMADIASLSTAGAISPELTFVTTNGDVVTFDLSSITSVTHTASADELSFVATGMIDFTGYDPTAGTLTLESQGNNITSFSATLVADPTAPAVTPEPSSLTLLGTGLLGAFGLVRRRMRKA